MFFSASSRAGEVFLLWLNVHLWYNEPWNFIS
jgi:hypothetical protein